MIYVSVYIRQCKSSQPGMRNSLQIWQHAKAQSEKKNWNTVHSWPRHKSQKETKELRQATSNLRCRQQADSAEKPKQQVTKENASAQAKTLFSQKCCDWAAAQWQASAADSASSGEPLMWGRVEGSPLTTCHSFPAQFLDLPLIKPVFFSPNFSSASVISPPWSLQRYFSSQGLILVKWKRYLLLYSVSYNLVF